MPVVFDSFIISLDISSIGTAFASAIVETFAIAVSEGEAGTPASGTRKSFAEDTGTPDER